MTPKSPPQTQSSNLIKTFKQKITNRAEKKSSNPLMLLTLQNLVILNCQLTQPNWLVKDGLHNWSRSKRLNLSREHQFPTVMNPRQNKAGTARALRLKVRAHSCFLSSHRANLS